MSTNLTGIDGDGIIRSTIHEGNGDVSVLQVPPRVLSRYVRIAEEESEELDRMRVLAHVDTIKEVMDDFLISSAVSDLVEDGKVELLSTEDEVERSVVLVGDDAVVSYADFGDTVGALWSDEPELLQASIDFFEDAWKAGDDFKIRTPPMSKVKSTLSEEIGEQTKEDFCNMLDVLDSAKGGGDGLDEVTIALAAAARNEILLYDISKWGEDSGVASKATFSRKKTELEDAGLIDTENVPIDIGRPRLRLKFADESLHDASIEEVVEATIEAVR